MAASGPKGLRAAGRSADGVIVGTGVLPEVVSDALKLMRERDAVFDEWLRSDVQAAIAEKQAPAPIDEVFKRVRSRVARRAKAAKSGA